jgi:signal transduction histidine kinase
MTARPAMVVALSGGALLVAAGLVGRQVDSQPYPTIALWHWWAGWILAAAAALVLLAAATASAAPAHGGIAQIALLACWVAPLIVAWETGPDGVRSLAMAISALCPVAAFAAVSSIVDTLVRRPAWIAASVLCAGAGLLLLLGYEPFRDPGCLAVCGRNPWAVTHVARAPSLALSATLVAVAVLATSAFVRHGSAGDSAGRTWARTRVIAVAALVGAAVPWLSLTQLGSNRGWVLLSVVGILATGGLVLTSATHSLLRRRRVASLVTALTAAPRPEELEAALAKALGDRVRITYPHPAGTGYLDAGGDAVPPPSGDRLEVTSRGLLVALLTGPGVSAGTRDGGRAILEPATALLVENASVIAGLRAEVARVREARSAVVTANDEARAELERDLHDGSQQLVLALAIDLRLLAAACADAPSLAIVEAAQKEVAVALEQLRVLAHGLHPAALTSGGLPAALEVLSEQTGVMVTLEGACDLPLAVALATYRLVEVAAEQARARRHLILSVVVDKRPHDVVVRIDDHSGERIPVGVEADRVAALGAELHEGPPLVVVFPTS